VQEKYVAQSSGMAFERRLIIAWPLIRSRLHADSQLMCLRAE
jgi:hypothetical protein